MMWLFIACDGGALGLPQPGAPVYRLTWEVGRRHFQIYIHLFDFYLYPRMAPIEGQEGGALGGTRKEDANGQLGSCEPHERHVASKPPDYC